MSDAITLSLDPKTIARLDEIAARRDLSRDVIVERALATYLDEDRSAHEAPLQDWQAASIQRGLADADAGRFVSADDLNRIVRTFD